MPSFCGLIQALLDVHAEDTGAADVSQTVCKLAVIFLYLGRLSVYGNIILEAWLNDANDSLIWTNESTNAAPEEASYVSSWLLFHMWRSWEWPHAWSPRRLHSWSVKEQRVLLYSLFYFLFITKQKPPWVHPIKPP